ncbi:Uncharacterised protein [Mycobacteroides abscessus subsp. abscessus]|nr:Uncharacterised protein [Mycobacteroides abscessus subsp. abscessus]
MGSSQKAENRSSTGRPRSSSKACRAKSGCIGGASACRRVNAF